MKKISSKTTRKQLAAIVVDKLRQHKIEAVLVGGSVVSIYTQNKYESEDLDFISSADHRKIEAAMTELDFRSTGREFVHNKTSFTVEFPAGPVGIGDDQPVTPEGKMTVDGVTITMLSPTQSVMDRLAWFFYANDRQCLDQAVWIAANHPIKIDQVKVWAGKEGQQDKLQVFLNRIEN